MSKTLSQDSDTKAVHHYSNADDQTTIQSIQDVSGYLRQNSEERAGNKDWKGDFHKVASIPMIVIEQWTNELGDNPLAKHNRKWLIAKLNSNDFLKLRTKEGRV